MGVEAEAVDKNLVRVVLGKTKGGKEIVLIRKPECSVRMIAFTTGGQLPKQLEGGFSSVQAAQHATDSYLAKLAAKEIGLDGNKLEDKPAGKGRSTKGKT